jgi:hypothetical protein
MSGGHDKQIDQVIDAHQTASVVCHISERERDSASKKIDHRPEISADARPKDQRRPHDDDFERSALREAEKAAFGLKLADAIWIGRFRLISRAEGVSGARALTIDLDGADKDEAPNALPDGLFSDAQRAIAIDAMVFREGLRRCFFHLMNARRKVDHHVDAAKNRSPICREKVLDRIFLRDTPGSANHRDDLIALARQSVHKAATDEAACPYHCDSHPIHPDAAAAPPFQ